MERRVKERLVGAAVLMAAAVILIPEMLSGPRRDATAPATTARTATDASVKTYTIDLSRSPGAESGPTITEAAPPPDEVKAPEPTTETPAREHQATPESTPPVTTPSPRVAETPPTPVPTTARTPTVAVRETPPPIASGSPIPTSRGWAVQLGSFASRATADRMASEVSAHGQQAFVMPVKSGESTLYRVRIGPFADRARANEVLRDVKSRVANAAVVAHP